MDASPATASAANPTLAGVASYQAAAAQPAAQPAAGAARASGAARLAAATGDSVQLSPEAKALVARLQASAALVAVPTLIAGIYGMNFKHMPELNWEFGYPMALAAMVGIDAWLFTRFRKSGWL